jgi:hypothetical protein
LTASYKDQNFKEHQKAYERSYVEIKHGRIQKKLSAKRLIKA